MSVFAGAAMALPPRYSNTRPQPPPYKAGGSQSLPSNSSAPSMPPPVYKTTTNTATSRSSSLASSISTITSLEPPQYASIVSAPQPKPQPTATRQPRSSTPTWKDPYVETDAADSVYELQQMNSRQRAEQEEEEDDTKNWCWGCFWVGPSMQQPWAAHLVI
jgi:hypothetical protein